MTKKSKTAFVTVNWNCLDTIEDCIRSILQDVSEPDIIIVDNNSADKSVALIKKVFPQIKLILNRDNPGFATAVNQGIKLAEAEGYEYIALLNPDAAIDKGWTRTLESVLKDKAISTATGILVNPITNTLDNAGEAFSDWLLPYLYKEGDNPKTKGLAGYRSGGSAGGSVYRISALRDIGYFDEKYFLYYEDTDVSLRLQHAGYKAYCQPRATGWHTKNTSSKKVPGVVVEQSLRNRYLLVVKNVPFRVLLRHGYKFFLTIPLFLINQARKGYAGPVVRSALGMVTVTPYALRQRRIILSSSKLSSSDFSILLSKGPPPIRMLELLSVVMR